MRISPAITGCCFYLFLTLTSVTSVQRLHTMNDLKKIYNQQSVPRHSLLLLYWFAETVNMDNNNVIRLTFDPNCGEYGSHHYGNYEQILEPLPRGNSRYRYYTVGNVNQETSLQLPSYVIHPRTGYEGRNRDRIVFRVREQSMGGGAGEIIDQVYMTQHYETSDNQGTRYDPTHTFQLTPHLFGQIRRFAGGQNNRNGMANLRNLRDDFGSLADDSQLAHIKNSWGDLACLGLLLFMVIHEKQLLHRPNKRQKPQPKRNTNTDVVINIPTNRQIDASSVSARSRQDFVTLKVKTGESGKAQICWGNVPANYLKEGVMVALYKNDDDEQALTYKLVGDRAFGSYNTGVPLNKGLQVRLHKIKTICCFWKAIGEEICRGLEYGNPPPICIDGYAAKLQLFAKDGKACARLYVRSSFADWRSKFKHSWVGFYKSAEKSTVDYEWWQWQWVTKFTSPMNVWDSSYDIYEYQSSLKIAPGVQARLILHGYVEQARTPCWTS